MTIDSISRRAAIGGALALSAVQRVAAQASLEESADCHRACALRAGRYEILCGVAEDLCHRSSGRVRRRAGTVLEPCQRSLSLLKAIAFVKQLG